MTDHNDHQNLMTQAILSQTAAQVFIDSLDHLPACRQYAQDVAAYKKSMIMNLKKAEAEELQSLMGLDPISKDHNLAQLRDDIHNFIEKYDYIKAGSVDIIKRKMELCTSYWAYKKQQQDLQSQSRQIEYQQQQITYQSQSTAEAIEYLQKTYFKYLALRAHFY